MRIPVASLLLALSATSAAAHNDVRPHRRPTVVTAPARSVPTPPVMAMARPPLAMGVMATPAGAFTATGLSSGGLSSGRLRSPLRSGADVQVQCRARCAAERLACSDEDTVPQCAPRWSSCVATCSR